MILVIAIAALALWGVITTIIELHRDGYRRIPTDPRRLVESTSDALQRAQSGHGYR